MTAPLPVLSLGCFVMGHVPYQIGLEQGFADGRHGIAFESVRLPEANRHDLLGRLAWHALTARLAPAGSDADYHRLRSELAGSLFARRRLRELLPRRRPAVLHVHTQSVALLSADLLRRLPSVVSLDCTSALLARRHPAPAARTYRPIVQLERRCLQGAAHVVCWSEVVRRSVIDDYGIAPARVSVVRPGVARHRLPARSPRPPDAPPRLLLVGNDFARKGGLDVLAVFDGGLRGRMELDIVSNGLDALPAGSAARLHRGLSSDSPQLLQLYADADVFVMPTYEDAFGLVFVEAMAAGLPCIGTRVLAVPELVRHGETGLTIEPGDRPALAQALAALADDPALRQRMGAAGRAFAALECDPAANCARLAALFRALGGAHERLAA